MGDSGLGSRNPKSGERGGEGGRGKKWGEDRKEKRFYSTNRQTAANLVSTYMYLVVPLIHPSPVLSHSPHRTKKKRKTVFQVTSRSPRGTWHRNELTQRDRIDVRDQFLEHRGVGWGGLERYERGRVWGLWTLYLGTLAFAHACACACVWIAWCMRPETCCCEFEAVP